MLHWGAQPIHDFISNNQWQTMDSYLQVTVLAVDVAATSTITTLRTSIKSTALPRIIWPGRQVNGVLFSTGQNQGLSSLGLACMILILSCNVLVSQGLF